jgi:DNA polymerase IV
MRDARRILLADADAFYVSVARLVDPQGAGRARLLIVGGSAEHRGVVTSASYEARAFGVHSAMPMARALRLCPKAMIVPVPWEACAEKGREIRGALLGFTPAVEQASSDEFYLDMSGTEQLYHGESLAETGRRIREAVLAQTALSVSIGGGTSRLVAKIAAGVAKPPGDGVYVVPAGTEEEFLRRFTLAELPGIGPKATERLRQAGFRTVEDVLPLGQRALAARLGERQAEWLYARVRGIDHAPIEPHAEARSISRDGTFAKDLDADDDLARELAALVARAAGDLREAGLLARTITVKLRDWDFTTRQAGRTLPEAVLSDRVIGEVARELLAKLRATRRVPARLVGVALSGLVRADADPQLSLLTEPSGGVETERDRTIARIMDDVRERFGPDALRRGQAG